jgi:GIY-YIG catalytic domain
MKYTIYKITNLINDKIYVGAHKTNNLDDNYMGSGLNIKRSIQKYGVENFKKEYIGIFNNVDEMFKMESEIVTEEFVNDPNTYNIIKGGSGGFSYINETYWINNKEKQRDNLKRIHKTISLEKKQKIGEHLGKNFGGSNRLSQNEIDKRLKMISDIDLNKFGWVKKVSDRLNMSHTQVKRFIKKYYNGSHYQRK